MTEDTIIPDEKIVEATASVKPRRAKKPAARRAKPKAKAAAPSPKIDVNAFLNSPAGQDALSKAMEAKFAELSGLLGVERAEAGTEDGGQDMRLVRQLVQALGEMSDQGSNRKVRVSPEEMASRLEARELMGHRIVKAYANEEGPRYELSRDCYLDEQIVYCTFRDDNRRPITQEIEWYGAPDESMVPKNAAAEEIHRLYMRSIGGRTKESRVAYKHAHQAPDKARALLRVIGQQAANSGPPELPRHRPGEGGLQVLRGRAPGEQESIRVLGTEAQPFRQVA